MKLLVFWDVFGRIWRKSLIKELPGLIEKYSPDFVIVNVDNISSWRWAIEKHVLELERAWVDIMTSWNHFFDNFDKIMDYAWKEDSKLLRFANYYDTSIVGSWEKIFTKNWKKLLMIHLQWEIFMNLRVNNPFLEADKILEKYKDEKLDWIVIDFHNEATSEIYWLFNYLNWRISLVFGTHTHVQTNDEHISSDWTWMISDVWMCWAFDSIIWSDFESVRDIFVLWWINKKRISQSLSKKYLVSWLYVELWNDKKCEKLEKIKIIKD